MQYSLILGHVLLAVLVVENALKLLGRAVIVDGRRLARHADVVSAEVERLVRRAEARTGGTSTLDIKRR